jgi:hypothetical protein
MPRIQPNPGLLECLDFASDTLMISHAPFINVDTTKEQAIQLLRAQPVDKINQNKFCFHITNMIM